MKHVNLYDLLGAFEMTPTEKMSFALNLIDQVSKEIDDDFIKESSQVLRNYYFKSNYSGGKK